MTWRSVVTKRYPPGTSSLNAIPVTGAETSCKGVLVFIPRPITPVPVPVTVPILDPMVPIAAGVRGEKGEEAPCSDIPRAGSF